MKNLPLWWSVTPWILGIMVIIIGYIAAYPQLTPSTSLLDFYTLFPLLGIWAWSLMWTHFVIGEIRRLNPTLPKHMPYHHVSSILVLTFILAHPFLLAIAQYQNGQGLPLGSYYAYAGRGYEWVIWIAALALTTFLSYEVLIRIKERPVVKKYWWFVNISQSAAMLLIFWHALTIGHNLVDPGWFRTYWITLGIILIPTLLHTHYQDWKDQKNAK